MIYQKLAILGTCLALGTGVFAQTCTTDWFIPNNVSISKVTGGIERDDTDQDTKAWFDARY